MGATFTLVKSSIEIGNDVYKRLQKAKGFKQSSERLSSRLMLLIDVLSEIKALEGKIADENIIKNGSVMKAITNLDEFIKEADKFSQTITDESKWKLMVGQTTTEATFQSLSKKIDEARSDLTVALQVVSIRDNIAQFDNVQKSITKLETGLRNQQHDDTADLKADNEVMKTQLKTISTDVGFLRALFERNSDLDAAEKDELQKEAIRKAELDLKRNLNVEGITDDLMDDALMKEEDAKVINEKNNRGEQVVALLRHVRKTENAFDGLLRALERGHAAVYTRVMREVGIVTKEYIIKKSQQPR